MMHCQTNCINLMQYILFNFTGFILFVQVLHIAIFRIYKYSLKILGRIPESWPGELYQPMPPKIPYSPVVNPAKSRKASHKYKTY